VLEAVWASGLSPDACVCAVEGTCEATQAQILFRNVAEGVIREVFSLRSIGHLRTTGDAT
jgi:hypothetical protein